MKAKIRQWDCTVKYNEKGMLSSRTANLLSHFYDNLLKVLKIIPKVDLKFV